MAPRSPAWKTVEAGRVIGVQFGDKKARCKVIWVVDAGQAQKIEAGVNMLEGQPCPWEKEMAAAPAGCRTGSSDLAPSDDKQRDKFPAKSSLPH